jgi:hypothetical protein
LVFAHAAAGHVLDASELRKRFRTAALFRGSRNRQRQLRGREAQRKREGEAGCEIAGIPGSMDEKEGEPRTIPSLRDTGEAMTEEEEARKTASPEAGYPAGDTEPHEGLTGEEGRVNAEATPAVADDAEHGQTASASE